jgi:hypothetical protein
MTVGISLLTLVPGIVGGSETYARVGRGLLRAASFTSDATARRDDEVYRVLAAA